MNAGTFLGNVTDAHGRTVRVLADRSGAVRLDLGLSELMLTRHAWAQLAELGGLAAGIGAAGDGDPCPSCGAWPGEDCDTDVPDEGART